MQTVLLADAIPLPNDKELLNALAEDASCPTDRASTLSIGIEGPDGEVYRVVETEGLWETVRAFDALRQLGLTVAPGREVGNRMLARVFREG